MAVSDSQPVSVGNLREVLGGGLSKVVVLYDGPLTAAAQLSEDSSDFLIVFVVASYRSTTASGVAVPGVIDSVLVDFDGTVAYVDVSGTSASAAMGVQVRKVIGFK